MKKVFAHIFGGTYKDGQWDMYVDGFFYNQYWRFKELFIKRDCAIFITNIQILYYKLKIKIKK